MTFESFFIILFIDSVIISLAVKTKLYYNIILSIRIIIPDIIMAFIILAPLFAVSLLITACNILSLNIEPHVVESVNEYSNGWIEFGSNLITYSPVVLLVFCFIFQWKNEIIDRKNIKRLERQSKRLKISMVFTYLAFIILIIFIFSDVFYTKNNFPMKLIQYIRELKMAEIRNNPEIAIRKTLIIMLVIIFYLGIFLIPRHFIDEIVKYDNDLLKIRKYRILVFLPFLNIYFVYILNKKMFSKNRKNDT
jgi:hypothetical protein